MFEAAIHVSSDGSAVAFPVQPERLHWYAVYTRSNFEKRVAEQLAMKGVEHFLPVVRKVHRWKDRNKLVELPVFPGYAFVRIVDCDPSRLEILRTRGTVRILGQGDEIEPVPDEEIESIRRLVNAETPFLSHPFLREGARVRVRRGPLEDIEGILVRVKSRARLVISISLLSQSVSTEIDIQDVEAVRPAAPGHQSAA